MFYFELAPVLSAACSSLLGDHEKLRIICEGCIRAQPECEKLLFADTGFHLIVAPGVAAARRASAVNLALLGLFFGSESLGADLSLSMYRRVEGAEARAVLARSRTENIRSEADAETAAPSAPPVPHRAISFDFAPAEDFKSGRIVAYFCKPFVAAGHAQAYGYHAVSKLMRNPLALDLAVLEQTLAFSRHLAAAGIRAGAVAAVSYETLARSKSREAYRAALRESGASEDPFLVLKIADLPRGIPTWRLADVIQTVRPLVHRIFVRLRTGRVNFVQEGFLGARGFVFDLPDSLSPANLKAEVGRMARICEGQGARLCIDNIANDIWWEAAKAGGAALGVRSRGSASTTTAKAESREQHAAMALLRDWQTVAYV